MQHATDSTIERQFAATDSVDGHACWVGRIFDGKFHVDLHRHVAKEPAFHTDEGDFVIELPRDIIARADVDVFIRQALADHGLHRFGFRSFLRCQAGAIEHVQEIGVAAGVQLVGAHQFHAALV